MSAGELKNVDVTAVIPAFGVATGVLTHLNPLLQGTSATTRLGRRVTMKSLYIRGYLTMAATSTLAASYRVLVVYDKQANAAPPTAAQILESDFFYGLNNLGNSRRFETLCDHVTECIGTGGPNGTNFTIFKKMNHAVEFNATNGGTIADIQTGSVYALIYMSAPGIGVATPANAIQCRIRFSDA